MAAMVLAVLAVVAWPRLRSTFEPPRREGPPGLVQSGAGPMLWLVTRQEEARSRHIGGSPRTIGCWITDRYYHFHLHAHDTRDAGRHWRNTLRVVKDEHGGHAAQARILGQQDDVVWLWLVDEPIAVSAADGKRLGGTASIEQANPSLRGLLPVDLKYYTWYGGLVVTLADARQVRMRATDFVAEPFAVDNDDAFRSASFNTTTWNGLFRTEQFGVRAGQFGGRWIGLLSDKERGDAIQDGFGDHHRNADNIIDEGATARRIFWEAKVGRTREFSEGSHPRLVDLMPIGDPGGYLQGRLMKAPDTPGASRGRHTRTGIWQAAPREPLVLPPSDVLVMHATRLDDAGRLVLSRIGSDFHERWRKQLPYQNLGARWLLGNRLLLYGDRNLGQPGMSRLREAIVTIDLDSGDWQGWDVLDEAALSGDE